MHGLQDKQTFILICGT